MPEMFPVALLYPHPEARPINEARVRALADSIKEVGLIHPLTIRRARKYRHGSKIDAYEIIAGHHRYEACARLLRMETIPCDLRDDNDPIVRLIAIDENLMRAELTDAQRAAAIAERKCIYEALHPETAHGGDRKSRSAKHKKSSRQIGDSLTSRFTKHTSDATGLSERSVQRMAERGEKLKDVLPDIVGTSLDKASELDALKNMPKPKMADLVTRAKAGETVTAKPRTPKREGRDEDQLAKLKSAYRAASPTARQKFRQWLMSSECADAMARRP